MHEMRRILALTLCFVMLVGMLPAGALATDVQTTEPSETVVETQVAEATDAAQETTLPAVTESIPTESVEESVPATTVVTEPVETTDETTVPTETEETVPEASTEVTVPVEATEGADSEVIEETLPDISMLYAVDSVMLAEVTDEQLDEALKDAKTYIDALTINNSSNDPETVVTKHGTHFTWDNEKRENSKSYLFDWSYYNGVVFEGIEYVYEVTGKSEYKDYVMEYMSNLIAADGTWAKCANDSSKECAGYNSTHGADCYKTASLLLDAYEMTGDSRYLTIAEALYADLTNAENGYLLSNAGNNFRHTWATDPSPDLWLDGLYMILPFRAEYAEYIGDTAELNQIVSRMQWVSDNMYDEEEGLFYHAADSASSNSGTFWLRAIGWYAAAIVDIMDSMDGDNFDAMQAQLVKLVDGMLACQNTTHGMWLNNMGASQSSTNPYETSGTALVCYAIMKAVNNGWLDESYADMATLGFWGICNEKLSGTTLKDICFKGAPGSSNSTFYSNEGKGVGPFIMLYAEVEEYVNGITAPETPDPEPSEPSEPSEPETGDQVVTDNVDITITVSGVSGEVVGAPLTEEDKAVIDAAGYAAYVALDVTGTLAEGETATLTGPIPKGWDPARVVGISVEDGKVIEIAGTYADGMFTFTVDHFSAKGIALAAEETEGTESVSGIGNLPGGTRYVLDTDGTIDAGVPYLIVSASDGAASAFRNNNGSRAGESVTANDGVITSINNEATTTWTFTASGDSWYISNGNQRIRLDDSDILNETGEALAVAHQGNGAYHIYNDYYYLRYRNSSWQRRDRSGNVYLFKQETSSAEAVTFTVTPGSATVAPEGTVTLTGTVTVGGEPVDLNDCTITWASSDGDKATVANGVVTGVADGTATITATLTHVNGTELVDPIVLEVPVEVMGRRATGISLSGNEGYVIHRKPDATVITDANGNAIKVTVTYNDNTTEVVDLTSGMISGTGLDKNTDGTYEGLTVTYGKQTATNFTLHVVENAGNNFPEYPDEGSVDVNKVIGDTSQFQNLGVAEVQLSTSGIPIKTGVNVLLIMDISNSMSWDDSKYDYNDTAVTAGTNQRLNISKDSAKAFAQTLLAPYEDKTPTKNTLTILNFAGIDDANNTHNDAQANDDVYLLGEPAMTDAATAVAAIDTMKKAHLGGTNYDYAFMYAYNLATQLYEENGQMVHIVFMTDGTPTHYNGVYYKDRDSTDVNNSYVYTDPDTNLRGNYLYTGYDQDGNDVDISNRYIDIVITLNDGSTKTANVQYNKGWSDYITGETNRWADKVKTLAYVDTIYSVGFGLRNGSVTQGAVDAMPTNTKNGGGAYYIPSTITEAVLKKAASTPEDYYSADNTAELTELYKSLAAQIRQAATNAYFVDQMGTSFDLQRTSSITKFAGTADEVTYSLDPLPILKVSTYNIYKKSDIGTTIGGVEVTQDMVGQRYGSPTVIETVAFSSDGTQAFSSIDGYTLVDTGKKDNSTPKKPIYTHTGTTNILNNGVIEAYNFWYNTTKETKTIDLGNGKTYELPAETFYWNIGTINDKEFVLSYPVYLVGSAEGQANAGTYSTNNKATLYYTNHLDNDVSQDVQSPVLAWKSASVYYAFYLVDNEGNPVVNQATGEIGSFEKAIKVSQRVFYQEVKLNSESGTTATLSVTSTVVPDEYELYDNTAVYKVTIDSSNKVSGWVIQTNKTKNTTYVTDYHSTDSSNVKDSGDLDGNEYFDYTSTTVWFAVVWEPQALPDTVVIDYGLPVDISVLSNDMFGSAGTLTGIGLVDKIPDFTNSNEKYATEESDDFSDKLETGLSFGTAEIKNDKVRYTPKGMQMSTYDRFAYEVKYEFTKVNTQETATRYYYNTVTVIPATTIYYEDSFLTFNKYDTNNNVIGTWEYEGTLVSGATQAEDRPGEYSLADANNIYGYDGVNLKLSTYSLGQARKVHVDKNSYATAEFTFAGTGFDVISMTTNKTGVITVAVTDKDGKSVANKFVNTYFDYVAEMHEIVYTYTDGAWVAEDKGVAGENVTATAKPEEPQEGDNYTAIEQVWVTTESAANSDVGNSLYQVPVLQIENLPYGKYNVKIKATYMSALDKTADDGYDLYMDAIRIYDPANDGAEDGDTVIEDAYTMDGEGWPSYIELRNKIIGVKNFANVPEGAFEEGIEGLVFIDGDASVGNAQMQDYISYGPNNEIYLAPGQRIAFTLSDVTKTVDGKTESIVEAVHIGLKSEDGKPVNYTIINIEDDNDGELNKGSYYGARTFTVDTTTDMYYDLTDWKDDIIVVSNTGGTYYNTVGLLSLTNIKVTYKENPNGQSVSALSVSSDNDLEESRTVKTFMSPAATKMTLNALNEEGMKNAPEETVPETTAPEATEPEVTEPEATEPEVTEPEETVPEETEPDDDDGEQFAETVRETIKKVINLLSSIFGRWL